LAIQHLLPYSFKFSKPTFTRSQLITLFCCKIKLRAIHSEGEGSSRRPTLASGWTLAKFKEDLMLVGHLLYLKLASRLIYGDDEEQKVVSFQMGGVSASSRT